MKNKNGVSFGLLSGIFWGLGLTISAYIFSIFTNLSPFVRAAFAAVVIFRINAAFYSNAVKIFKQVVVFVESTNVAGVFVVVNYFIAVCHDVISFVFLMV